MKGPSYSVAGKVVAITGAGRGIGRELAVLLYRRGASVALIDIDKDGAAAVADRLGSARRPSPPMSPTATVCGT